MMREVAPNPFQDAHVRLSDQLSRALRSVRVQGQVRFRKSASKLVATFVGEPSPLDAGRIVTLANAIGDATLVQPSIDALRRGCLKVELGLPDQLPPTAREAVVRYLKSPELASLCGRLAVGRIRYADEKVDLSFPIRLNPDVGEAAARARSARGHRSSRRTPEPSAA